MPKIRINNKDFELDNNYYKELNENPDIQQFKNSSPEYNGQSEEDILDILIAKEKDSIDNLAVYDYLSQDIKDMTNKLTDKYRSKYESNFDAENNRIKEKWGKSIQEIKKDVVDDYLTLGFSKKFKANNLSQLYSRVKLAMPQYKSKPEFYKQLKDLTEQTREVLDYEVKFGGPVDITKEQYVENKLEYDYSKDCAKDPEYQEIRKRMEKEKDTYTAAYEADKQAKEQKLLDLKHVKYTSSQRKEQCVNLLKERDNLAKDYYKTNIFSRIARWCLPNSWSKAGQIQNELDKIDKAIKDAGYEKKDVENIKNEIKSEKPIIENDNLENQAEVSNEINDPQDDINLHQGLKDKTVDPEIADKSQAVENDKNLQRDEVAMN